MECEDGDGTRELWSGAAVPGERKRVSPRSRRLGERVRRPHLRLQIEIDGALVVGLADLVTACVLAYLSFRRAAGVAAGEDGDGA
jgi:hypothetical protein